MIKTRDLVRQLNLESYVTLQRKFDANNQALIKEVLIIFRNKLYSESKMAELLSLSQNSFFDIKQGLRREIFNYYNINQDDKRCSLLFKINYLATRPSEQFSSEENFTLINCLQELIDYRMEYEASPLFEKLAQLNRDTQDYNEYYNLFRTHFNIKQSSERSLSLLMHLNSKLAEYTDDQCLTYIKQIDRTFLEIKNIQTFNENKLTNCITNISLLVISLFCKDSKYSFTRNQSLNTTFIIASDQVDDLPSGPEQFYFRNILFFCAAELRKSELYNDESLSKIEIRMENIPSSVHYNFNFPKSIAESFLSGMKKEKNGPKIIDIKQYKRTVKTRNTLKNLNTYQPNHQELSTKHYKRVDL